MILFLQALNNNNMQEGRQEGETIILLRQLNKKFGLLSQSYREKILNADTKTLLLWSEKILDAKTIEEVFSG